MTTYLQRAWATLVIAASFALGWVFQFLGHGFEGKSPQFMKRPENLLLGPVMIMTDLIPALRPSRFCSTPLGPAAERAQ